MMEKPCISELVITAIGLVLIALGVVFPEKLSFLVGMGGMGLLLVLYWHYHKKEKELRRRNGSLFI